MRSSLSDVELDVFASGVPASAAPNESRLQYLPYRMCMAQLAVMCTQREKGLKLVKHADRWKPTMPSRTRADPTPEQKAAELKAM